MDILTKAKKSPELEKFDNLSEEARSILTRAVRLGKRQNLSADIAAEIASDWLMVPYKKKGLFQVAVSESDSGSYICFPF